MLIISHKCFMDKTIKLFLCVLGSISKSPVAVIQLYFEHSCCVPDLRNTQMSLINKIYQVWALFSIKKKVWAYFSVPPRSSVHAINKYCAYSGPFGDHQVSYNEDLPTEPLCNRASKFFFFLKKVLLKRKKWKIVRWDYLLLLLLFFKFLSLIF